MKSFTIFSLKTIFILVCLLLLESACFRLLDDYANWRLQFAWGKPKEPQYNSFLKKVPLDHYVKQPTDFGDYDHHGYWVKDENLYALRVTSFTRPKRDSYENFLLKRFEPLANYEIRDYGDYQGVVLPGLKKLANVNDVKAQKARRVGDELEYAKGVFIKIVLDNETFSLIDEVKELEASFGFLLEEGFACAILPVSSSQDLISKTLKFRENEELLSRHLFGWAEDKAASILMESVKTEPDLWKAIMLSEPDIFVEAPLSQHLPWIYCEIDEDRSFLDEGLDALYNWITLVRSSNNLYASRLAGLIRISKRFYTNENIPSHFIAYAIFCSKFIEEMEEKWPLLEIGSISLKKGLKPSSVTEFPEKKIIIEEKEFPEDKTISLIKRNSYVEFNSTDLIDKYNCDIIRTYREINSDDAQLNLVSNRDLILKLGLGFERLGNDVFNQIRVKDPLFYRYYKSFRAIEESPLN